MKGESPYKPPTEDSPVPAEEELERQRLFWKRICAASLWVCATPMLIGCGWSLYLLNRAVDRMDFGAIFRWEGQLPRVLVISAGLAVPGFLLTVLSMIRLMRTGRELKKMREGNTGSGWG